MRASGGANDRRSSCRARRRSPTGARSGAAPPSRSTRPIVPRSPRAPPRSGGFWRAANRSTESIPASASWRACASSLPISPQLQRNIVLSHAAGVGEPASVATTRLMMALKLGSLAQGASGVQPRTLALIEAHARSRRHAGRPVARIGRRLGRSGAARPYGGGDDRRRRRSRRRSRSRPPPPRSPKSALSRLSLRPKRGLRSSTARNSRPPMRSSACSRPKRCSAPRWRPAHCRPTARAARIRRSTRAFTR